MVPTYIHTLRFKLTFLHTAVFALLITGTCVLFLNIQRRGLLEDIDDRLHARAETVLEDFVALRDEGLSISAPGRVRPWIDPKRFPSFFVQFRNKSGSVIHRSQTLQTGVVTTAPAGTQPTSQPARTYAELALSESAKATIDGRGRFIETIHGADAAALVPDGSGIRLLTQFVDPQAQAQFANPRQKDCAPFYLQVALPLAGVENTMSGLRRNFLIVIPVGLLVAGISSWLLARRSLAPIGKIAREAHALTALRLDRRMAVPEGRDEVAEMVLTINDMLDRLETAFRAQERFIADAAHELKTPVAILLSGAQVLTQKARSIEEYEEFVAGLQDEMRRIGQMVDSLLTLARADAGLSPTAATRVSINEVVTDAVGSCQPLAVQREVRLVPRLAMPGPSAPEPTMVGDDDLLTAMVSNLIRNAIRHAPVETAVEVEVVVRDRQARIHVRDSGPGIDPAYLDRVFDRFFQVPTDTHRMKGSGLGLAIAKGVARLHRGTIEALNRPQGGCEFIVTLPITTA